MLLQILGLDKLTVTDTMHSKLFIWKVDSQKCPDQYRLFVLRHEVEVSYWPWDVFELMFAIVEYVFTNLKGPCS